jgi:hypothetical protein
MPPCESEDGLLPGMEAGRPEKERRKQAECRGLGGVGRRGDASQHTAPHSSFVNRKILPFDGRCGAVRLASGLSCELLRGVRLCEVIVRVDLQGTIRGVDDRQPNRVLALVDPHRPRAIQDFAGNLRLDLLRMVNRIDVSETLILTGAWSTAHGAAVRHFMGSAVKP